MRKRERDLFNPNPNPNPNPNLFKAVAEVHISRDEEPFELANREGVERTR